MANLQPETQNPKLETLKDVLGALRRRERLFGVLTVMVVCLTAAVLFLLGEILVDGWVVLQRHTRNFLLLVLVLLEAGGAAIGCLVLFMRRRSDLYLAKRIEDRYPGFQNALIACVESRACPHDGEILRHIADRVAEKLERVNVDEAVPARPLRRSAGVLCGVLAVAVLYALVHRSTVTIRLQRVLFPRHHTLPPTATRIWKVEPGTGRVLRNRPVRFVAHLAGIEPEQATLHTLSHASRVARRASGTARSSTRDSSAVTRDSPAWTLMAMRRERAGLFSRELPSLSGSIIYYVSAGDTRSDRFALTVLDPPVVTSLTARVTPPAYSGLPASHHETGHFQVLVGSRVRIEARTNVDVGRQSDGTLRAWLEGSRESRGASHGSRTVRRLTRDSSTAWTIPLKGSARTVFAEFTVAEPLQYRLHFEDADGNANADPVTYTIGCLADRPPTVSLVPVTPPPRPAGRAAELAANGRLRLRIRAADDLGLATIALRFRVRFGPWNTKILAGRALSTAAKLEPRNLKRHLDLAADLDLGPLELVPGNTLTYYVTCDDSRLPRPGSAATRRYEVRIRAPETVAARRVERHVEKSPTSDGGSISSALTPAPGRSRESSHQAEQALKRFARAHQELAAALKRLQAQEEIPSPAGEKGSTTLASETGEEAGGGPDRPGASQGPPLSTEALAELERLVDRLDQAATDIQMGPLDAAELERSRALLDQARTLSQRLQDAMHGGESPDPGQGKEGLGLSDQALAGKNNRSEQPTPNPQPPTPTPPGAPLPEPFKAGIEQTAPETWKRVDAPETWPPPKSPQTAQAPARAAGQADLLPAMPPPLKLGQVEGLIEAYRDRVAPEYQKILEAYYRALARQK